MREIGEKAGLSSTASVTYQLQILEEKGWIRRDPSRGRAIEITLPGQDGEAAPQGKTRLIPLVGRIAAGNPILAEQEVEEVLPLPESLVGKGDLFLLQVKGDSVKQLLRPGLKKMAIIGYCQQMIITHQFQQMKQ
jgi:repressor LexA